MGATSQGRARRGRTAGGPAGGTWAPRGGEAGGGWGGAKAAGGPSGERARRWLPGHQPPRCVPDTGQAWAVSCPCDRPPPVAKTIGRGPSEHVGKPPAAALTYTSRSATRCRAVATELASSASPPPLLPDPPRSPFSSLPLPAASAASIFQIFLEPAAPRAAVARVLTEAAEVEAGSSLGRGGGAGAPPQRPNAQAQTQVTAGWRRPNRSGERPGWRRLRRGRPPPPPGFPDALPSF